MISARAQLDFLSLRAKLRAGRLDVGAMRRLNREGSWLVALLAGLCLYSTELPAQDATWSTTPGSNDFNTASNWSPSAVPTGTAVFGPSTTTLLQITSPNTLGGFTFNTNAPLYDFGLRSTLTFTGAGVVNNSPNRPFFAIDGLLGGIVNFRNTSTAGAADYQNQNSTINFFDRSSAGAARFTGNTSGASYTIVFNDSSGAGTAAFTLEQTTLRFRNTSSAQNATIGADPILSVINPMLSFEDSSSAGNATIGILSPRSWKF
jgi:hypothetical protein